MRLLPVLFLCLLPVPVLAASREVTLYLDAVRVEQELPAANGYLELPLSAAMVPGSLRVKPVGGGAVHRVEILPAPKDSRRSAELARLAARREALTDRLEILAGREEIFSSAAKAHAGRALKRTRNTPDPMATLRQGADYALAQLEQASRSRKKAQRELEAVERELAQERRGEALARVWLGAPRARISYLRKGTGWIPCYDFRLSGPSGGELSLHARLPAPEKGVQYLVSPGPAAAALPALRVRNDFPLLSRFPLTLDRVAFREAGTPLLSFRFRHEAGTLPPGEASGFFRGEYLGTTGYTGIGAGELSFGP